MILIRLWTASSLLTLLAALVFLVSLWPFYFPVRYRCDETGVSVDYRLGRRRLLWVRRVPWTRFRSYGILPGAVVLSPFLRARPLERFRVLLLPCPDNRNEVVACLPPELVRRGGGEPTRAGPDAGSSG